jgi:hypothetical protein
MNIVLHKNESRYKPFASQEVGSSKQDIIQAEGQMDTAVLKQECTNGNS